MFATETQARNQARDFPLLGSYIARLDVPDDAPVRAERTLRTRGHHTLWADPQALLRYVGARKSSGCLPRLPTW